MQNVSKITFVILGAIIGAGFISGQEIYLFFCKFGTNGIIGIIISGITMYVMIKKTCCVIKQENIHNYSDLIQITIPIENRYIKLVMNNIISIFLLISFFIMCAAFNSYFNQEFKIPIYLTGMLNSIFCYYVFVKNHNLVIRINQILMPVILFSIIFLFLKNNSYIILEEIQIGNKLIQAVISGIIYASYNSILLIPILITLNQYFTSKKQIKLISLFSTIIIIILAVMIYILMCGVANKKNLEIPLIYIANNNGSMYYYIYSFIILIAIFTTTISVGYGFLKNTANKEKNYKILAAIIGIASVPISYIGFSNLVSLLYPIFGILGVLQIIFILKY